MQHSLCAAALLATLLVAPVAVAQGPANPTTPPVASQPSGDPSHSGDSGTAQRAPSTPSTQEAEQGREEAAPPHQGGGCPYRQRPLELIV